MTKLEAIIEAYGEFYDEMKPWIDENGWFDKNSFYNKTFSFNYEEIQITFTHKEDFMRPLSLNGIDTNNGWVELIDRNSFPVEDEFYWFLDLEGNIYERHPSEFKKGWHVFFQTIEKPKHPIYDTI